MPHGHRLSALDASFLHLETGGAHMHVAAVMIFEGAPPAYEELTRALQARMHLVPRYRQRLAGVPLAQGRPVWVDDPHFNIHYHVRHAALPAPGTDEELKRLASRVFAQALDRSKPLWEVMLVEGLRGGRFALMSKTHHALVDGVSGVDLTAVLFDTDPEPAGSAAGETGLPEPWQPRPLPTRAQLLADALIERATVPAEALRGVRALTRRPRQALGAVRDGLSGVGAMAWAGVKSAPPSPLNVPIGPHRRYTWVDADLDEFKRIKNALGGTVNDVVLTVVALALGRWLRDEGHSTDGLVLKAMVPVSVRADAERGALGNRVAAMWAPLPVDERDPKICFKRVSSTMSELKRSGQAVGAQTLTQIAEFAPPTIMSQAARLQARQRLFNLVVTNVPGPQVPLYILGRRLTGLYPVVPLAKNQALGIAIMSYDGALGFGLNADYDALPSIEAIAGGLRDAVADLSAAAEGRAAANGRRRSSGKAPPTESIRI